MRQLLVPEPLGAWVAGSGPGRKKAIVRKFSRDWLSGYLDPLRFACDGKLELLDATGKVLSISLSEVKMVCFVREFLTGDAPERLVRRNFTSRPRTPGLWLRLRMKDGDEMEGLASNDLSLLEPEGIQFTPPDMRSNTQRIFVPRSALQSVEIVAVIHPSNRRKQDLTDQERLFAS
ncbi:MAG: DUF6982 domain-containing protein [Acidobacteriaceae bacterium]